MKTMKKGELDEKKIMKRLSGFLLKDIERQLFNLPAQNQEKPTKEKKLNVRFRPINFLP